MSLPTSYLTSSKNLVEILTAMRNAQAPKKFTQVFLEGLGFKGTADRLIIGVLKALGMLTPGAEPTQRYFEYLDQTQSGRVLAEALHDAYADLYQVNTRAHELANTEIRNKLKTLTQGQFSDAVLDKMAMTFKALAGFADFGAPSKGIAPPARQEREEHAAPGTTERQDAHMPFSTVKLGGLVYNIQLHLPESRDPAVYDALFKSLKEHLLR